MYCKGKSTEQILASHFVNNRFKVEAVQPNPNQPVSIKDFTTEVIERLLLMKVFLQALLVETGGPSR
jgi:hypothetical protein